MFLGVFDKIVCCKTFYNILQLSWVLSIRMQDKEADVTTKKLIEQFQKANKINLSQVIIHRSTATNGEFLISKCLINKATNFFFGSGSYCLFFINTNVPKNRFLIGYLQLDSKKINHQFSKSFQYFIENILLTKSSYIQTNAIEKITYDIKDPQIYINFKAQKYKWKLQFSSHSIFDQWEKHLRHFTKQIKSKSTSNKAVKGVKETSSIPPVCSKVDQKPEYSIVNSIAQRQLSYLIGDCKLGSDQQVEKTLHSVIQMSKTPVQLTVYMLGKIKAAEMSNQNEIKKLIQKNAQLLHIQNQKQNQIAALKTKLQSQHTKLSQKNSVQHDQIEKLNACLLTLKLQCEYFQAKLKESLTSISQLEKNNKSLQQKLVDANRKEGESIQKLQSLQSLVSKLQLTAAQNSTKIATLSHQLAESQQRIDQQNRQIHALLQKNTKNLESKQAEIKDLSHKLKQISRQVELMSQQSYLHIFEGLVLHDYLQEKEFLRKSIESYTKMHIKYTHLLYRFDNINKANFHKYIDQHSHICLVVRLSNGMVLAGYSQDPISGDKPATKGGLICSLTSRLAFELLKGLRSVTYDDYFLIFGNSQLRIRWGELMLFSNFAISNGYYDARGEKYTVLMGSSAQRTQKIENYQIFEVKFN